MQSKCLPLDLVQEPTTSDGGRRALDSACKEGAGTGKDGKRNQAHQRKRTEGNETERVEQLMH